jgi:hypothetical protein
MTTSDDMTKLGFVEGREATSGSRLRCRLSMSDENAQTAGSAYRPQGVVQCVIEIDTDACLVKGTFPNTYSHTKFLHEQWHSLVLLVGGQRDNCGSGRTGLLTKHCSAQEPPRNQRLSRQALALESFPQTTNKMAATVDEDGNFSSLL